MTDPATKPPSLDDIPADKSRIRIDTEAIYSYTKGRIDHTGTTHQIEEAGDGSITIVIVSDQDSHAHRWTMPAMLAKDLADKIQRLYLAMPPERRRRMIQDHTDRSFAVNETAQAREAEARVKEARERIRNGQPAPSTSALDLVESLVDWLRRRLTLGLPERHGPDGEGDQTCREADQHRDDPPLTLAVGGGIVGELVAGRFRGGRCGLVAQTSERGPVAASGKTSLESGRAGGVKSVVHVIALWIVAPIELPSEAPRRSPPTPIAAPMTHPRVSRPLQSLTGSQSGPQGGAESAAPSPAWRTVRRARKAFDRVSSATRFTIDPSAQDSCR